MPKRNNKQPQVRPAEVFEPGKVAEEIPLNPSKRQKEGRPCGYKIDGEEHTFHGPPYQTVDGKELCSRTHHQKFLEQYVKEHGSLYHPPTPAQDPAVAAG